VDLFFLLIIVIFIVGPIIEKAMKGGRPPQGPPVPPGQRPPPRRVQQRFPQIPTPEPTDEAQGSPESAAEILPSDLWEMLTGQRPSSTQGMRTRPAPTAQTPAPARPAAERLPPDRQGRLTRTPMRDRPRTASTAPPPAPLRDDLAEADALIRKRDREEAERRMLHRGGPEIVSLETPIQSEPVRHKAFHKKLEQEAAPAVVDKPACAKLRMDRLANSELQRAVLLHEILGTPKGMEE